MPTATPRPWPRCRRPWILAGGLALGLAAAMGCTRPTATADESAAVASPAPPREPPTGDKPMIVDPTSTSALLRATHVTVVTVVAVAPGTPTASDGLVEHVPTALTLELEALLVGWSLEDPPPTPVTVTTTITRRLVSRIFAVPGVWSEHAPAPGGRFVLLSASGTSDPVTVLSEPQLFAVHAAEQAEADVRLAVEASRKGLDLGATVASIPAGHPVGEPLASYLAARAAREVFYGDEAAFAALMELMVRPAITPLGRSILATQLAERLTIDDPAPAGFRARYVAAVGRLLEMPQAAGLHHNLLSTQLPIVIGLVENAQGEVRPIHPDVMFADHPSLRWSTEAALVGFPDAAAASAVLAWIQS